MKQLNKYYLEDHTPAIPDGRTVEPTDDIQIWIRCAGRKDLYTTLGEVLADTVCLAALMADNNAVDYLVRSTTWTTMCSNLDAMNEIGANNYAANTLIADSTWLNAICGSIYRESVLNVTVPVMTSATTPSGTVSADSTAESQFPAWAVFNPNGRWYSAHFGNPGYTATGWVAYSFTSPKCIKYMTYTGLATSTMVIAAYNGSWVTLKTATNVTSGSAFVLDNDTEYTMYRVTLTQTNTSSGYGAVPMVNRIQFYGREDI